MRATVEIESETAVDEAQPPARAGVGRALLASGVAVAALVGLVLAYVVLPAGAAEEAPGDLELASAPAPRDEVRPGAGAAPSVPAVSPATSTEAEAVAVPAIIAPDAPAGVVVPDFATLRVPAARRQARALGLHLVVRDTYGQAIDPYDAPRYVVLRQRTEPGAQVPAGSTVRLVAEDPTPPVMGY